MAGQPTFTVHISLTVNPKSVYLDVAERLLDAGGRLQDEKDMASRVSPSSLLLHPYKAC